jgi:hypothetical protein
MRATAHIVSTLLSLPFLGSSWESEAAERKFKLVKIERPFTYYEGSVVVSGFYHEQVGVGEIGVNFEKGLICFSVKGPTEILIPRNQDSRSPWFCFSNTEKARAELKVSGQAPEGTCFIFGKATVQISKYVVDKTESEVHDTANLDRVISFEKPVFRKECSMVP